MASDVLSKEIIEIYCKWSKSALINCLKSSELKTALSENPFAENNLDRCLAEIVNELLIFNEERSKELSW